MNLMATNTLSAMMTNWKMLSMNEPYLMATAACAATSPLASTAGLITHCRSVKFTPPMARPMGGMMMSVTMELTTLPNAAPMMTPTARSSALPLTAKSVNSLMKPMAIS